MAIKTIEYKVVENKQTTPDVWSISVKPVEGSVPQFKPGQFFMFYLLKDGKLAPKPYSIASSPTSDFLQVTYKLAGFFTHELIKLKVGDKVQISGPFGVFVFDEAKPESVFIAGGVGLTPFMSMIRFANEKKLSNKQTLLFSNKTKADIIFEEELDTIAEANEHFTVVNTLTREEGPWSGEKGRIDKAFIEKHLPNYLEQYFYLCGATPMVKAISDLLNEMKVPIHQVKMEKFGDI